MVVVGVESNPPALFLVRDPKASSESVTRQPKRMGEVAEVSFAFTPMAVIPRSLRIDANPIDRLKVLVAPALFNNVAGLKSINVTELQSYHNLLYGWINFEGV